MCPTFEEGICAWHGKWIGVCMSCYLEDEVVKLWLVCRV
jgi:hypothetical protein